MARRHLAQCGFLLLLPLALMQFTHEMNWDRLDFLLLDGIIALLALTRIAGASEFPEAAKILLLNSTFAGLWLLSAWLFRQAADKEARQPT